MRLKDRVQETYLVVKTSVSTVWFWIPVLFALYIPFQMYMMLVNPLLLAIAPVALVVYLIYEEEWGFRAKYRLDEVYQKTAREPVFWDIERFITESRNRRAGKK